MEEAEPFVRGLAYRCDAAAMPHARPRHGAFVVAETSWWLTPC
jgi:hypothetical protein